MIPNLMQLYPSVTRQVGALHMDIHTQSAIACCFSRTIFTGSEIQRIPTIIIQNASIIAPRHRRLYHDDAGISSNPTRKVYFLSLNSIDPDNTD